MKCVKLKKQTAKCECARLASVRSLVSLRACSFFLNKLLLILSALEVRSKVRASNKQKQKLYCPLSKQKRKQ